MKKNVFLLLLTIVFNVQLFSQYQIGHTTITFEDPSRGNRAIETEIFYPADVAGDDVSISAGQFPYIVFGHGFTMSYDAYQNFVDTLIPMGYILAFPTTEGSMFGPSHEDFGLDLKFLISAFAELGTNSTSLFYTSVGNTNAIMGHSMGGGSSFLAAQNNTSITTLINFAAAETDPSSTDAAVFVTVPTLVFAGEEDGVAPPADNQLPMYEATGSSCKTYISINGGSHCFFANSNFYCDLASSAGALDREGQHAVMFKFLKPWLNYYLKNISIANDEFVNKLTTSTEITYLRDCPQTIINESADVFLNIFPNPASNFISIENSKNLAVSLKIFSLQGKLIKNEIIDRSKDVSITDLANGVYLIKLIKNNETIVSQKLIVIH